MVTWIPEKFAVPKRYLELKNENGEWENGWFVEDVTEGSMEERYIVALSRTRLPSLERKRKTR